MRRMLVIAVVVLSSLDMASPAHGSTPIALHEASRGDTSASPGNVVGATVHSNAWFSLQADYLRRIALPWPNRRVLVGVGLDLPMLLWIRTGDPDTARISVRCTGELVRVRWFSLVADIETRLGVQDSGLNTSVGWDFQVTVAPSVAFERWSLSPFVGLRQGITTYIRQGDIVRDAFEERYPAGESGITGPENGWIAGGNTRIPFGLAVGVDLPREVSLDGSAGFVWTYSPLGVGMFDAMMLGHWPFFVELGASWRF